MSDVHDKKTRSYNMSRIKGKNTKPEILVRKFLFSNGFRYKLHDKKLSGKPDIVLSKLGTIILIHGCFWHGHVKCKYYVIPKTRKEFWENKINCNKKRDQKNVSILKKDGWKVVTIFECELKGIKKDVTLKNLLKKIHNESTIK